VLHALRSLEQSLPEQVRSAYASHPSYLLQAKLSPVIDFSRLLGRLLRVNATAHAAAKFLSNPADCALMLRDWSHYLDARRLVMRELPCGADRAIEIIENEIPALLSYSSTEMYNNHMQTQSSTTTPVGNAGDLNSIAAARRAEDRIEASIVDSGVSSSNSQSQQYVNMGDGGHIPTAIEGAIDRWAGYLQAMPSQFPLCPPRVFLWAMGAVETSVLREITVSGGEAFGLLWVVRCWVDEWMAWLAERGGFLASSGVSQHVQAQQYELQQQD
jgi:regulatory factor X